MTISNRGGKINDERTQENLHEQGRKDPRNREPHRYRISRSERLGARADRNSDVSDQSSGPHCRVGFCPRIRGQGLLAAVAVDDHFSMAGHRNSGHDARRMDPPAIKSVRRSSGTRGRSPAAATTSRTGRSRRSSPRGASCLRSER